MPEEIGAHCRKVRSGIGAFDNDRILRQAQTLFSKKYPAALLICGRGKFSAVRFFTLYADKHCSLMSLARIIDNIADIDFGDLADSGGAGKQLF